MDSSFYHFLLDGILVSLSLLYPMYHSFNLLELKKYEKSLILWLSYWLLYALFWNLERLIFTSDWA